MVKFSALQAVATLAVAGTAMAADVHGMSRTNQRLHARQSSGSIMASDYQNGDPAPGARSGDAAGQTVVIDSDGGHDDNSQRAGCPTIFIGSAAVGGSFSSGWSDMPQVLGFDTMRDLTLANNVVQPYIIERGKTASQIKRVVITQPGLPRDYWKYANLVRNSLLCASVNSTLGINRDEILIAAPTWFSTNDATAGSAQSNDLVFNGGGWATGVDSAGPMVRPSRRSRRSTRSSPSFSTRPPTPTSSRSSLRATRSAARSRSTTPCCASRTRRRTP